ncbi:hypothetical protein [Brevibacillus nitrificans]|uniref:hypothetical protein n=1 Tax=Brevibacillus nitrificans TaxID=651560 RepID=UPI0028634AF6|nr:hypothetical protein [Brevibacillus nitrificans]MDR7315879.1 hypothetical protein [Brevibacillus nitrificans]
MPTTSVNEVNVNDYLTYVVNLNGPNEDWSPAIQQAIDDVASKVTNGSYESNVQGVVRFPIQRMKIRKPILLPPQVFMAD